MGVTLHHPILNPFAQPMTMSVVADPKYLKRGGGRQFISSVLIYRKCAQRNICLLHEKKRLFEKYEPGGGAAAPFESA